MAKSMVEQYAPWVALIALILTLINVAMGLLTMEALAASLMIPSVVIILGFVSILMTLYALNKFQFRHMQDLTWFGAVVAILLFVTAGMAALVTPDTGIVYTIVQGFIPLLAGLVGGGVVALVVGFLYLPGSKKKKLL
jgi:hypothetical protein